MRWSRYLIALAALISIALAEPAPNPVHWSCQAPQRPLRSGATFTVKLLARIDPGWHLYGLEQDEGGPFPAKISLADDAILRLGSVHASKPIEFFDTNFDKRVRLYVDKAEFSLPLTVLRSAKTGPQHASIHVRYQCCNDTMCLSPKDVSVDLPLKLK